MIQGIDHIGIAVANLQDAMAMWDSILGKQDWHRESVPKQGVDIASTVIGDVRIELTAASNAESTIAKFIAKRGPGIHHIALRSDNLTGDLETASANNIRLINHEPQRGAHAMNIAFLHPSSTGGVLIEYCSTNAETHT